ncbi:MAG: sn-glycerol-3-phosphate ABC transporter ATP-binding protein UgpC [Desulfobacterales bacterium]|nr:sn-glycerol-3-phosphate ABC transporter ATP-binding protein UgpC [Desulfobacterales bacterium]MDX2511690.1 sn-glycerol-3-phosphate ABC transporter ATP-binding protein UgpC [Desulfobacterales bacterium]
MAGVTLKNVNKKFDDVTAVKDLSIQIQDKAFAVLVGPSGCGKTTVLRSVAGLEEVTSGEIYIGDSLVNDVLPKDRDIAMVFQNYALYPHMDIYDNMAFSLNLRHVKKDEIDRRVHEAADILGIEDLLHRKPRQLSGGQRQRVAVGRTIVRKPKVFLFDEPLSNLDAMLRVAMRAEISKLHRRLGATIIYVTHDQVEAMTMAEQIFIMNNGTLQQSGMPLEVYRHPVNKFVAGFIGSPAMNFIDCRLIRENENFIIDAGSFKLKTPQKFHPDIRHLEGKEIFCVIRPEYMYDRLFGKSETLKCSITAGVEVIEPLGAETHLYLACGRHSLVAKMDTPQDQFKIDQKVDVLIDMEKTHIFDMETSQTIV